MSMWHQRGPGRGENAPWSGAGKVEVLQSCTWSCKEGPVPQGCLPAVPWDGNRNGPQFHPPNSEKALFISKGRIMAIMALQEQLHSPGICKVTRNTCSGKSLLLVTVDPWDTPPVSPTEDEVKCSWLTMFILAFSLQFGCGGSGAGAIWLIYLCSEGGWRKGAYIHGHADFFKLLWKKVHT